MIVRLLHRFKILILVSSGPAHTAMLCCLLMMAIPVAGQRVYQPPVPAPKNPAAFAWPRDDWYITVQEKFDRNKEKSPKIIFDGDSITNRWETTGRDTWKRFAEQAVDFGIEGDRTENLLWRLSKGQVDGMNPKLVVLLIGTNNIGRDSPEDIAEGVWSVVAEYEKRCPHAHIALMAIFPRGRTSRDPARLKVEAVNHLVSALVDGQRVSFVDIGSRLIEPDGSIAATTMPDYVHPAADGYVMWADALTSLVEKYVAVDGGRTSAAQSSVP